MSKKGLNIYKRKDNRWEGRFFNGRYKNGRKQYSSVYGNSYIQTKEKLISKIAASNEYPTAVSFEICSEHWLSDAEQRVKRSTFANYRFLLEKHIKPYFRSIKMHNLTNADIERFKNAKLRSGKLKRSGGLSKKYVKDIILIIKQIAAYAELHYNIPDRIRNTIPIKPDHREINVLKPEEKKRLTKHLIDQCDPMNAGILISLYTGLRLGEVCGLQWGDFDEDTAVIHVRRTVQKISDGHGGTMLLSDLPKSRSSMRIVPLPDFLTKILTEIKSSNDSVSVITGTLNFPEPAALRKSFKTALRICKIRNMRYHDLRHTFASDCVRLGFDIKALSGLLGHSSAAMTLDRYAHTSLETKQMYMKRITI